MLSTGNHVLRFPVGTRVEARILPAMLLGESLFDFRGMHALPFKLVADYPLMPRTLLGAR
jgi:hypothetical protein